MVAPALDERLDHVRPSRQPDREADLPPDRPQLVGVIADRVGRRRFAEVVATQWDSA
jgi:hypothetical protein